MYSKISGRWLHAPYKLLNLEAKLVLFAAKSTSGLNTEETIPYFSWKYVES